MAVPVFRQIIQQSELLCLHGEVIGRSSALVMFVFRRPKTTRDARLHGLSMTGRRASVRFIAS
jgi:hypothetical protein